jgi:hypothetical protein
MTGYNEWNSTRARIDALRAQYEPKLWKAIGDDEPARFSGAQHGDVMKRWQRDTWHTESWHKRQPMIDRVLFWAVMVMVGVAGPASIALQLMGWM